MTRLYFTCPIKALWMHIEFGVKFDIKVTISANLSKDKYVKNATPDITKIYVAKESEHIFDYKKGDLVNHKDQGFGIVDLSGKFIEFYNSTAYPITCANSSKIIMRNDKHFFQADEE